MVGHSFGGAATLIAASRVDEIVPVTKGERVFALASQPKAFQPLVGADHLLIDPAHTAMASRLVVSWFDLFN